MRKLVKKAVSKHRPRHLGGVVLGNLGFCTSWAINNRIRGREWIETVDVDLRISGLPEAFEGKRLVQVSDLHCSRTVSCKYLKHCIDRINHLKPDIVVLTGDYVTCDVLGRFSEKVIRLISDISSRYGVYACMGNHDYGTEKLISISRHNRLRLLMDGMEDCGVTVLRNESTVLEIDSQPLRFVGMGDIWAKDFHPDRAFRKVRRNESVIVLSHNPATAEHLSGYSYDAMMSGHTHGSAVLFSASSERPLVHRPDYVAGMYSSGSRKIYVNRGLGRHGRVFNARPEITVFTLRPD
ncbi:MAG: metallophosphoesterase [Candidatus Brocadiia bacterium]|nr:MAG: metallophosphoesterase [Candidatus Brocadiia bacterium]